jgi:hypothetical protein
MSILIPNKPLTKKLVMDNGELHPEWDQFFDGIITTLQQNLSSEGVVIPPQTTANITALNTQKSIGALLYDQETKELKVNIDGTFKVVQTS